MPDFVIQGEPSRQASIRSAIESLGGQVKYVLEALSSLAQCLVWIVEVPQDVNDTHLSQIEGIYIVEGKFFHSFYSLPFNPLIPNRPPKINEYLAASLQLMTPEAFSQLPGSTALSKLLGLPILGAGAFEPFNTRDHPFSSPNLFLGPATTEQHFQDSGDLARILDIIRVPQAHQLTRGNGSIVAIVDSGINPRWVPPSQRLAGWSGDGSDPWVDSSGHGSMVAAILMAVAPECQVISIKPTPMGDSGMSSQDIIRGVDRIAQFSLDFNHPIISNHSWGIWGTKNLVLPCTIVLCRSLCLLDHLRMGNFCWAAGNNRDIVGDGTISGYCMNTTKWSASCAALDRNLRPQFYSSWGAQCYPWNPSVSAPTYGVLPWGDGYVDFEEQGGATSSCAPMLSGAMALAWSLHPDREPAELRAAVRMGASNARLGLPGVLHHPATGSGLLQVDKAIESVPLGKSSYWYALEKLTPSNVARLGEEPERRIRH